CGGRMPVHRSVSGARNADHYASHITNPVRLIGESHVGYDDVGVVARQFVTQRLHLFQLLIQQRDPEILSEALPSYLGSEALQQAANHRPIFVVSLSTLPARVIN